MSTPVTANSPLGVFDSGVGGLTVVRALRDLLPNESIVYLGDTARVPYGSKSPPPTDPGPSAGSEPTG